MLSLYSASAVLVTSAVVTLAAVALLPVLLRPLAGRERVFRKEFSSSPLRRLGGIAVLCGVASGTAMGIVWSGYAGSLSGASRFHWIGWLLASGGLFAAGVADDLRGLGARVKLAAQAIGATVLYLSGFRIDFLTLPIAGRIELDWLAYPATLAWIIGVTNAINLIDGLDGLAAGICLIAAATISVIGASQGEFGVSLVALSIAGSLAAFLRHNAPPATVYLGDCGSQFLGFTLATLSIRGLNKSATAAAILAPILILGVPLFDTILVILRRLWRGRAGAGSVPTSLLRLEVWQEVFRRDREHVHYNLVDLGFSARRAVLVLYGSSALLCLAALALVLGRMELPAIVCAAAVGVELTVLKLWAPRSGPSGGSGVGGPVGNGEERC